MSSSAVCGTILLAIAFAVPTGRMKANVKKSIAQLQQETDYFSVTKGKKGSQLDNFTEAIYLNAATVGNKDAGIFTCLRGYTFIGEDYETPVKNLAAVANADFKGKLTRQIVRFWNGYLGAVKLLLCFTDYAGIRYFNLCLQAFLMVLLFRLMRKRGLEKYEVPLLISWLFMNPVSLALCMTFAGFFYCIFGALILMLIFNEKLIEKNLYPYFFETLGICVIFFNENYFQLATFGFSAVFYFLLNGFPNSTKELAKKISIFFAFWFAGYAGMMVSKWIVLFLCTGENIFKSMINAVASRTSSAYVEWAKFTRLDAIVRNVKEFAGNKFLFLIELAFFCIQAAKIAKKKVKVANFSMQICLVFALLFFVVARYMIFANHVFIHCWVTYRLLAVPLFAFNVLLKDLEKGKV